jgi:tetratricopeptide (TPR) repeat protein
VRAALSHRALGTAALAAALHACAPVAPAPPPVAPSPSVEAPPPSPPSPSARQKLAGPHNEASERLERAGDLRRALDERKIALTIDPEDREAQEAARRLEAQIQRGVAQRLEEGRAALARGAYVEARRRFLAALALDPTSAQAQEALRREAPEMEMVNHTVRAGETLASIAQQYYGDSARAEVIADANHLAPGARLAAGRSIKVPEIPGVPFHPPVRREMAAMPPLAPPSSPPAPAPASPSPPPAAGAAPASPSPPASAVPGAEAALPPPAAPPPPRPASPLASVEAALERRQYAAALSDVDRYLAQHPGNADGVALKKQVLYRLGKTQYDQKNYAGAYRNLTELAKLAPSYEDSPALIQDSRRRLIDQHYGQGIRYYREEKLAEAIAEWRQVLDLDPQHANARRNIEQSEKLLKGLAERKKKP